MRRHFTAGLPDGSQSRAAWLLWMVGGVVFSNFLVQSVVFFDAVVTIAPWSGEVFNVAVSLIEAALVAVVASTCVGFARRRLLMPSETWLAIALPIAAMCMIALRDAFGGSYLLAYLATVMAVGLAGAWLLDRRGGRHADAGSRAPESV